jgi:hypothetical protein
MLRLQRRHARKSARHQPYQRAHSSTPSRGREEGHAMVRGPSRRPSSHQPTTRQRPLDHTTTERKPFRRPTSSPARVASGSRRPARSATRRGGSSSLGQPLHAFVAYAQNVLFSFSSIQYPLLCPHFLHHDSLFLPTSIIIRTTTSPVEPCCLCLLDTFCSLLKILVV